MQSHELGLLHNCLAHSSWVPCAWTLSGLRPNAMQTGALVSKAGDTPLVEGCLVLGTLTITCCITRTCSHKHAGEGQACLAAALPDVPHDQQQSRQGDQEDDATSNDALDATRSQVGVVCRQKYGS